MLRLARNLRQATLTAVIITLAACSSTPEQPAEPGDAASGLTDALAGTHWQAENIYNKDAETTVSTLMFNDENSVSGTTGCNNYSGQVTREGTNIEFGMLATTRKMCEPAVSGQETAFLEALDSARTWRKVGGQLELVDAEGSVVMSLREFKQ